MANAKGADTIFVKKLLQQKGKGAEAAFLARLSSAALKIYHTVMSVSWIPVELNGEILEAAALTLYPDDPRGLQTLGRAQAKNDLSGIYKILARISTIPMLMQQVARLWKTYNDQGRMVAIRDEHKKAGTLTIEDYPELPMASLQQVEGYILGTMELAGAKNIRIQEDLADASAWTFHIMYD